MKIIFLLFSPFFVTSLIGQPQDYYNSAKNKKGEDLKSALHNIIKNHTLFPYTSSSTDVWDILKLTDRDTSDTTLVELIYSGDKINGAQEYNNGSGWTREHIWAKSRGDFGTSLGAGTDVHALRPCNNSINSTRNNRAFDECINCNKVNYQGSPSGNFTDNNLWTFEPRNEVKGDIARMLFYMATRYEQEDGVDLELDDTIRSNTDKLPKHGVLTTLLYWNEIDSVDEKEERRNEIIYSKFQKNRNPYIDYPELAYYVFGAKKNDVWMQEIIINTPEVKQKECFTIKNHNQRNYSLYNPTNQSEEIIIINAVGQIIERLNLKAFEEQTLQFKNSGIYFISGSNCSYSKKIVLR